jgi:phosphoglycolate phosphatase-like HAD superfamily hydrolase
MSEYGVIFDMDGVLVDSYRAHFASWRALYRELDRDYSEEAFAADFGRTSGDILRRAFGESLSEERIPGALEDLAVLRVQDRCVLRAEAEELRVEQVHALERETGLHVGGIREQRARHAASGQLLVAEPLYRFHPRSEIGPELLWAVRSGEAQGDAHDGDVAGLETGGRG